MIDYDLYILAPRCKYYILHAYNPDRISEVSNHVRKFGPSWGMVSFSSIIRFIFSSPFIPNLEYS